MQKNAQNKTVNNTLTYTLKIASALTLSSANVTGTVVGVTPNNGSSLAFSNPSSSNITYTFPYTYSKQINTTTNFSISGTGSLLITFNQFNYMYNMSVNNG